MFIKNKLSGAYFDVHDHKDNEQYETCRQVKAPTSNACSDRGDKGLK